MSAQLIQIETPRLMLRPLRAEDFDSWAELLADPEAAHFIGGAVPRSLAWRAFMTMAGAWYLQGFAMFSVIEKATGRWIGRLGPWYPEGWPGTEIGWALVRDSWGRGYATEGAAAAMDWAFSTLGWKEESTPLPQAITLRRRSPASSARAIASGPTAGSV